MSALHNSDATACAAGGDAAAGAGGADGAGGGGGGMRGTDGARGSATSVRHMMDAMSHMMDAHGSVIAAEEVMARPLPRRWIAKSVTEWMNLSPMKTLPGTGSVTEILTLASCFYCNC